MAPGSSGDKENLKVLEKHPFSVDLSGLNFESVSILPFTLKG